MDTQNDDGIGVLVFCQDKATRGIDSEVSGFFAAGRKNTNRGHCTFDAGTTKNSDAVMAAIGSIKPHA